jgi:uncharacterized surface protein with fasciclin (FAS1) repeats
MKHTLLGIATVALLSLFTSCDTTNASENEANKESAAEQLPLAETAIEDNVSQKDVVQVAMGSKDHSTLVAAIKQAELVGPLRKSGPFTVFAPTNEAFEKLPKGTVENLLKAENKEALADILEYHVSVGIYKEDMMQDGQSLGQVNSQNVIVSKKDGKIKLNGTANIVGSVPAANGIIYIIDEVLLPPKK